MSFRQLLLKFSNAKAIYSSVNNDRTFMTTPQYHVYFGSCSETFKMILQIQYIY